MIRVAEIYRYPVKSMLGERLMTTHVDELGIIGDRAWALKDEAWRCSAVDVVEDLSPG
jgi:uncharacterized protein